MEKSYETFVTDHEKAPSCGYGSEGKKKFIFQTMEKNMAVWEIGYL